MGTANLLKKKKNDSIYIQHDISLIGIKGVSRHFLYTADTVLFQQQIRPIARAMIIELHEELRNIHLNFFCKSVAAAQCE